MQKKLEQINKATKKIDTYIRNMDNPGYQTQLNNMQKKLGESTDERKREETKETRKRHTSGVEKRV